MIGITHFDCVFNKRATDVSMGSFLYTLCTNAVGPIIVAQQILKHLPAVGKIVFITSDSGSAQGFRPDEDG